MKGIKQWFSRRRLYGELSEEIQEHLEEQIDELVAGGMSRSEATHAARREFGNVRLAEENSREVWRWPTVEDFFMDVRFGARMLRKNPGFTAVAIVTLALAIAVNSTIFSAVSAWILRPPNIKEPGRVAVILTVDPAKQGWGWYRNPVSVPDFIAWRAQSRSFEDMTASEGNDFTLTGTGEPELVGGRRVSANFFDVSGVPAALGRTFVSGEDQPGQQQVVVLSHALWQRRFASNPRLIGETVNLNGEKFTVIGVMPNSFALNIYRPQLWTPLVFSPDSLVPAARENRTLDVLARLKSGVNVETAKAEMATLAQRSDQANPGTTKGWSATAMMLQRFNADEFRVGVPPLMGAVIFVLLIGCANIASLQLARATERQRELAVRTALGAGRFRLVRQLLIESLLLAFTGGALGLLLAYWGVALFRGGIAQSYYAAPITIDQNVLLYTVGMSFFAAIVFGLAPALHQTGLDRHSTLKLGTRTGSHTKHSSRIHSVLVCVQIAFALALVTGAEIYVQDFLRQISDAFGIDPNQVLTANISLSSKRYTEPSTQAAFFRDAIRRLNAVPGVIHASATSSLVPNAEDDQRIVTFSIAGQLSVLRAKRERTEYFVISPDYLRTMRIPLLRGRSFLKSDGAQVAPVALVNQTFVQRYFPNEDPLGKHLRPDTGASDRADWAEIVGVVGNATSHNRKQMPQIYEPYLQQPAPLMTLAIRTSSDPAVFAPALRQAVWAVDKDQPVTMVATMNQIIADYKRNMFTVIETMGFLALFGLALAMMGVFGVIAYAVARRTKEIGIRIAIGAQGGDVVRMVVKKGLLLSVIGVGTGLILALPILWLRLDASDDAELLPFNQRISIFLTGAILIGFAALLASYIPARRATRVDPIVALRHE
jgi:putative ABC transport system permease protein